MSDVLHVHNYRSLCIEVSSMVAYFLKSRLYTCIFKDVHVHVHIQIVVELLDFPSIYSFDLLVGLFEVRGKHSDANKQGKYNYPYGLSCWAPVLNICRDRK